MTTKSIHPIHQLPYYGATREEIAALGADPDEVEAERLAAAEGRLQAAHEENVQLVAAAQDVVMQGDATYAQAAQALLAAGKREAHDALVALWQEDENWYAEQEAAEANQYLDAGEYAQLVAAVDQQSLATQEAEIEDLKRRVAQAQVTELQSDLKSFVASTPGAHEYAPQVEERLVQKLQASGVLPSTATERAAAIEEALKETAVVSAATESIRQQVDTEWRLHRKGSGGRDGLMTQADIGAAEAAFKEARFKQLADSRMIDLESLKPGPTAEEQSTALADKYREREAKSTDFRTEVAGIAERGTDADAARDRGVGISEERKRYREAVARAEAEAQFGSSEIKSGYGDGAPEPGAKDPAQLDEYGGVFPGFQA
jgi:hypothetical protein